MGSLILVQKKASSCHRVLPFPLQAPRAPSTPPLRAFLGERGIDRGSTRDRHAAPKGHGSPAAPPSSRRSRRPHYAQSPEAYARTARTRATRRRSVPMGEAGSTLCRRRRGTERNGERFFALASFEVNLQLENVKENCHTLYDASEVTLCRCGALLYTIRSSFVYNLVELFMYRRTQVTLCRCGALLYTIVELFVYRRC